jgi:hypothetical protein
MVAFRDSANAPKKALGQTWQTKPLYWQAIWTINALSHLETLRKFSQLRLFLYKNIVSVEHGLHFNIIHVSDL